MLKRVVTGFSFPDGLGFLSTGEFITGAPRPGMMSVLVPILGTLNVTSGVTMTNSANALSTSFDCHSMLFGRGWRVRVA